MDKLIYVHVVRFGESLKEGFFDSGFEDAANDWYVIRPRSDGGGGGVEMSRVFEEAGQLNHPNPVIRNTGCEMIGSCLYVFGGTCIMCEVDCFCKYVESAAIRCLDTRNPKDGWKTCFTMPFSGYIGQSAVVDDQWLCIFPTKRNLDLLPPGDPPSWYAFNVVDDRKTVKKIALPGDSICMPFFSACLSPSTLTVYMLGEDTLYQLDCSKNNSSWSVYDKDLPCSPAELSIFPLALDDGILYIYHVTNMQLISYDLHNKKKLHVVDLPQTFWFGTEDPVQLIVLSKNRFCLIWDRRGDDASGNETHIYYSRFSVSYDHLPNPTVFLEETHRFSVVGVRVLNVVAADPHADNSMSNNSRVDMAGGEKPI